MQKVTGHFFRKRRTIRSWVSINWSVTWQKFLKLMTPMTIVTLGLFNWAIEPKRKDMRGSKPGGCICFLGWKPLSKTLQVSPTSASTTSNGCPVIEEAAGAPQPWGKVNYQLMPLEHVLYGSRRLFYINMWTWYNRDPWHLFWAIYMDSWGAYIIEWLLCPSSPSYASIRQVRQSETCH